MLTLIRWATSWTLIIAGLWYFDSPRNLLLSLNKALTYGIVKTFLSPSDPNNIETVGTIMFAGKWVLLVAQAYLFLWVFWWWLGKLGRNARAVATRTERVIAAHLLGIVVFFGSVAFFMYEFSILWGDVAIRDVVLVKAWEPKDIYPSMTAQLGIVMGAYIVLAFSPAALRTVLGVGLAFLNVISSAVTAGVWLTAFFAALISTSYAATPFRMYALEIFAPQFVADLLVILVMFRLIRRGYVAATEEVVAGPSGHL